MTGEQHTVAVACSDPLFLEAAAAYMNRQEGWRVVATTTDGLQALAAVGRLRPSTVLALGELDRVGVRSLAKQIRRRWPETTVVFVGGEPTGDANSLPADADASRIMAALGSMAESMLEPTPEPSEDGFAVIRRLTGREREILRLLADGKPFATIARELGVSEHTVRTHTQNVYAKLGCHTRVEVVRFAARYGLLNTG
jgi:DNA-binding NarL/FixJ family response regulator